MTHEDAGHYAAKHPKGTVPDAGMDDTPFSSNPLDTLNRGIEEAK